ncbi:BED zinc finger domain-containing protein [Pochonia chlamydosporia 170]|uniref:BED zinc finger domain-containing protein n=1 Tax=Pochonia chlamydosporia 170 TaxID=1380566 RepID=A0A219ANP3_METCM|nr:BED zinc finger domain-containing protein [Pochonia chlamydosporia 170]OWT42446.1 BED zinc finger domain-containing protein [Pochonia chlamydosporia 170]
MLSRLGSEPLDNLDSPCHDPTLSSPSITTSAATKRRYSKVWHYTPVGRNEVTLNAKGKSIWRCKYCAKEYLESGGTTVISTHLKDRHNIDISSTQETRTAHQTTDYKRRCLSTIATHDVDPAVLEQLYDSGSRPAVCLFVWQTIDNWLPNSPSTIRSCTLRTYETQKLRVKRETQLALSKVHFTVDLWTSPNALAILGIVAHYTSESGQLEYSVLALRELDGKHSGPNMADCVMEIINDYGIASKVGYFMMDNADNNGTMMKYQIVYNAEHHRLRCNGHIINLAAQSFLFQTNDESLADENNTSALTTPTELEMEQWRRKGPLGKLHNIVAYIQRSPQRLANFRELSGGRNLVRDNSTRWNSWYAMIRTATKLKTAINLFCHQYQENSDDLLSEKDWQELQKLQDFLLFFYDATTGTEGRNTAKEKYADDPFMSPCCNSGWAKLDKYYSLTDRSPVYIAALVLSPQWKWDYIDNNWPSDWREPCRKQMLDFWTKEYKSTAVTVPTQTSEAGNKVKNSFHKWAQQRKGSSLSQDEYTKYLLAPIVPEVTDPRSWWLEPTQRKSYPALSIMALDVLSIPAMSAEPERLFSGTKITITDRRNRMGIESIEATECLKSWLGKGSRVAFADSDG